MVIKPLPPVTRTGLFLFIGSLNDENGSQHILPDLENLIEPPDLKYLTDALAAIDNGQ